MIWCHANKMVQVVKEHPAACQRHSFSVVQSRMCSPLALINQWAHLHSVHVSRVLVYLGTCYMGSWSSMCLLISFNQSVGRHPPVLLKWKSDSDYTFVTFSWDILSNFKLIQNIHYIVFVLLECGNTQINQNSHAYDTFVPPDLSITQRVP